MRLERNVTVVANRPLIRYSSQSFSGEFSHEKYSVIRSDLHRKHSVSMVAIFRNAVLGEWIAWNT